MEVLDSLIVSLEDNTCTQPSVTRKCMAVCGFMDGRMGGWMDKGYTQRIMFTVVGVMVCSA